MDERVQAVVYRVRASKSQPTKDVVLLAFTYKGKERSTELHAPEGQLSVDDVITIYIREGRASLT